MLLSVVTITALFASLAAAVALPANSTSETTTLISKHTLRAPNATSPTITDCTISPSAPSLTPTWLFGGGPPNGTSFWRINSRNVSISAKNSTIFHFSVPPSFPGNNNTQAQIEARQQEQRCALQFRFPYCDKLPAGYPCFEWTGLEQMELAKSGMRFAAYSTVAGRDWQPSSLGGAISPKPPGSTTIGTFLCGPGVDDDEGDEGEERPRKPLAWLGESFNEFGLDFHQAGGDGGLPDGMGLFIVACS